MAENKLIDLSKEFAIRIVELCTQERVNRKAGTLWNQLLRSGTGIGANIHEANYASSRADFINKMRIALKECYESDYWMELFKATRMISEEEYRELFMLCSKIRKMLVASINTAAANREKETIS